MSGAGLFCDGLLVGVVAGDPLGFASQRVTAARTADLASDPEFATHMWGDDERYWPVIEPVELAHLQRAPAELHSAAALLRADVEAVHFRGRADVLRELHEWCVAPIQQSALLLTGPGGQGKTRLSRQFGRGMSRHGWAVLHLSDDRAVYDCLRAVEVPLLVVVDYAETRGHEIRDMVNCLPRGVPVRLLLVARTVGEWLEQLASKDHNLEIVSPTVVSQIALRPLEENVQGRRTAFADALAGFVRHLSSSPLRDNMRVPKRGRDPDWSQVKTTVRVPDLSQPRYSAVLAVQMEALALLLDAGYGGDATPVAAEAALLRHERRYWDKVAELRNFRVGGTIREWAVGVATACTAANPEEAQTTVRVIPGLTDQHEDTHLEADGWLHDLYPGDNLHWATVQPDRLAEYLVARVLASKRELLDRVIPAATDRQVRHALTVLNRAAVERAHVRLVIARLLDRHATRLGPIAIELALEAEHPDPLKEALAPLADRPDAKLLLLLLGAISPSSLIHRGLRVRLDASLNNLPPVTTQTSSASNDQSGRSTTNDPEGQETKVRRRQSRRRLLQVTAGVTALSGAAAIVVAKVASPTGQARKTDAQNAAIQPTSATPAGQQHSKRTSDASALANVSEIPVGGGKVFVEKSVVVTQPAAGQFNAFSAVCTHQGCRVDLVQNGTIDCPCHGSRYSAADGSVRAGPASSPLPARVIRVEGDSIFLVA